MIKDKLKLGLSAVSMAAVLALTGCSKDDAAAAAAGDPDKVTYTGDRSLSGTVETFGSSSTSTASARGLRADEATEMVKLYVLDEKGDMKDTGITCSVTNGSYACDNIAGDKEYIVRYMKKLDNGKVLEMKSNVAIASTDVTDARVDRVSTLIVEAISKAVEEAIVGVGIDESKVADLIASVKTAIKSSISTLVTQGLITIPSQDDLSVELTGDETFTTFAGETKDNENLASSSGVILTDDSVANTLNAGKNDAKLASYGDMTKKELVKTIFSQTMDDGVPDWVVNFLGDKYEAGSYTVSSFQSKVEFKSEALNTDGSLNSDSWMIKDMQRMGLTAVDAALISGIVTAINTGITDGSALSSFKSAINDYYTLKAKDTPTEDEISKLADFPPVIPYLFSEDFTSSMTADTKFDNLGQALVYFLFLEDVYAKDIQKSKFSDAGVEITEAQLRNMRIAESDPMFLFKDLGFIVDGTYDTLSIGYFEAKTDKFWNNSGEVEFLSVYAEIEKPGWMMSESSSADATKLTKATLTYPTASGTKDVDLTSSVNEYGGITLSYSPWGQCDETGCPEPDATKMNITDDISGDYTVSITYDGEATTKTFDTFVLKGAGDYKPKMISPTEMPQWPEALSGDTVDLQNLTTEQQTAMDNFNTAQQNYQITTFSADENGTVRDVVFKWSDDALKKDIAKLNLPENIVPAYQVSISLFDGTANGGDCDGGNWDKCNTEIYNTWWNNRPIKGTSFKLPIPLKETSTNGRYNIGVNLVFLDKDTGRDVGQGGHTWAEFKVGTASVLTGDENVTFTGSVSAGEDSTLPSNLKVLLIKESCTFDATTYISKCTHSNIGTAVTPDSDGNYSLAVKVSDIKTAMEANSNINIIAFEDRDSNGIWTGWNPDADADNTNAEMAWWSDSKHIWFDNWGEFTVNSDSYNETTDTHTYDSEKVTSGANVAIDKMDFTIWK